MKILTVLFGILCVVAVARAGNYASLGYREDTIIEMGRDYCSAPYGLIYNHDFSFENCYCWQMEGILPPYYGAFGESYATGDLGVECVVLWLTQTGDYQGQPLDVYMWEGGISGPPSRVLCVVPGVTDLAIGYWPTCTMNEIWLWCGAPEYTLGYWADFSGENCAFYLCADENGFGGYPWTCVAPGMGFPTGWQPANVVWPHCVSLGIGATLNGGGSPVESQTWGTIKALFE